MELDFVIEYKKGAQNKANDVLSWVMDHEISAITTIVPNWLLNVESSYKDDEEIQKLMQPQFNPYYHLLNGVLWFKQYIYIGSIDNLRFEIFN